jgi:DNA-binding NarL/FixJ family response regulator
VDGGRSLIRVVVVDREAMARESIATILEAEEDLDIIGVASDGRQAVRIVSDREPDVAVVDLDVPVIDGVRATRILRKRHPALGILAWTTFVREELAFDALRAGATGYCAKSDPPDALVQAVRIVASGESVVSPGVLRALLDRMRPLDPQLLVACSPREREVLTLIARGATNTEIAERLVITDATVRTHVQHLRRKLGARTRAELVVRAYELGYAAPWPSASDTAA